MRVAIVCAYCGMGAMKESGTVNRAIRLGAPLYCDRECAGKGRRVFRTDSEKRAEKAAYDAEYRERNRAMLKAKKAAYYASHVDREKEREVRKKRMPQHVEYCRRPEYRKWKAQYDRKYLARKRYGDFGAAAIVLRDLEAEIASRASRIEISRANGTLNKHQNRRRDYERKTQRR